MGEPAVWGDFEVHEDLLLGRGGMGAVYKARQRSLDRWVAVKVFDPARVDPSLAPGFLEKFRIEIQALARLRDPRIVTIHQAGENDGRVWFAMELIEGETVEDRLSRQGAFPEREAVRVGAEVARALEAAFREGIVHRDVKPGNIFLLRDGSVKLADFGLARSPAFAPTPLTDAQAVACTPAYTAPEEAEGGASTDPRSDLYSLGCVLYEMVTERPPFVGTTPMETLLKHATEPPRPPRALNPALSREFEEIVLRCLAKDPAGRYGSPGALAAALEKLAAHPAEAPPRRGATVAAAGLALAGVVGTAILWDRGGRGADGPAVSAPPLQTPACEEKPAVSAPRPAFPETAAERAFLARLLALSRETLAERRAWRFEGAREALERLAGEAPPGAGPFLAAERERLRAGAVLAEALRAAVGKEAALVRRDGRVVRGRILEAGPEGLIVEGSEGAREAVALWDVAPESVPAAVATTREEILARSAAGGARGCLAALARLRPGERAALAPLVVDQAIEEALGADLKDLAAFEIPAALASEVAPVLTDRLARVRREREAAALYGKAGGAGRLLADFRDTRAGERAATEALAAFERALPPEAPGGRSRDEHEVVSAASWPAWEREGEVTLSADDETFALRSDSSGPAARAAKALEGARRGYRVRFRFSSGGAGVVWRATFAPGEALEVGRREAVLVGPAGRAPLVRFPSDPAGGTAHVFPLGAAVLLYLDGRLVAVRPGGEGGIAPRLDFSVSGGSAVLESVRVVDRNRF
jgi:hypothetical protein